MSSTRRLTLPCTTDPPAWDIPYAKDRADYGPIRRQVAQVRQVCTTLCPLVDRCAQLAHDNPPQHSCVQGGEIWPGVSENRRHSVAARLARAAKPVPYAKWRPQLEPKDRPPRNRSRQRQRNQPTTGPTCGTTQGIEDHRRRGEKVCTDCGAVRRAVENARRAARRAATGGRAHPIDMGVVQQAVAGYPPSSVNVADRLAIALELLDADLPIEEAARRMGCSTRTVHRIFKELRAAGISDTSPDGPDVHVGNTGWSFRAAWPIRDRGRGRNLLVAEARDQLPTIAAQSGCRIVGRVEWSITERRDRLIAQAAAVPIATEQPTEALPQAA